MKFYTTGFLAGIFGTYRADGLHKQNACFLCGRRPWDNSEVSHQGGGGRQPVSQSRLQSQQGGSVSTNVAQSHAMWAAAKLQSHIIWAENSDDQVRCRIVSGRYTYLAERDTWSLLIRNDGCNEDFYHATFPEFTIRVTDPEDHMVCDEEWTRGEIRTDNNHAGYYELYYHQTRLARVCYIDFDDHKKSMVAPSWKPWGIGRRGSGRFYFYRVDSINYAVHTFYSACEGRDHSTRGEGGASEEARSRWGHYLQIPVLRPGELEDFLGSRSHNERDLLNPSRDKSEQYQLFLRNLLAFEDWCNSAQ